MGKRILLGCAIVLLCTAGATAVFVVEQVHTLSQDLSANRALRVGHGALAPTQYGSPETLLMVGDDTRKGFKYYNAYVPDLANEMLLIRIDPSKPWISMMSIPRELWVTITKPDGTTYTNRLNSAYAFGATTLLRAIKQVTGVVPNHMIATTFAQFERAIDTLGCVYDTIDERYYHSNAGGGEQYQEIDLQPGYQCLNGVESEQFVSYRHTDTSQVRDSRDQSFLLAVKKQYGPELAGNIGRFERIFGKTVETDASLHSATEILNLANLLITASGLRVRQVPFQAAQCSTTCPAGDLTATPGQIHASVHNFLFGGQLAPTKSVAAISHKVKRKSVLAHLPLTPTLAANVAAQRNLAARIPFTPEFPKVQDSAGAGIPVAAQCTQQMQPCLRNYLIHAPDGSAYPIYVEVFSNGQIGQFYDVQGSTWTDAPLFANPDQTVNVGNRTYDLFYEGVHLQTVAWREHGAIYWVHNTLVNGVSNGELLAIAEQTEPTTLSRAVSTRAQLSLRAAGVPLRPTPTATTSSLRTVGSIAGLLTLFSLPVLAFLALRRRRQLTGVREVLASGLERGARLPAMPLEPGSAAARSAERMLAPPGRRGADSGHHEARRHTAPRRRGVWLAVLAAVICAGAAVFVITRHGGTVAHKPASHAVSGQPAGPPTVQVAILNAGTQQGAASTLATQLRGEHVSVGAVGNVAGGQQSGVTIQYAPGQAAQAERLARLLSAQRPTLAPLSPATAAAAGSGAQLVVVIG